MFSNLSLSENTSNAIAVVVDNMLKKNLSYFEGIIGGSCVVGVFLFWAMYAISLWNNQNNENNQQIKMLQLMLEKQEQKMESLEKELELQKISINNTHNEVDNNKILIQGQMDMIDSLTENLEHAIEEVDHLSKNMDKTFCLQERKIEDNINKLQENNEKLLERLEENENQLYSVEEELFERVKEMGDRVEEVDRSVVVLELSTAKFETDLETYHEEVLKTDATLGGWRKNIEDTKGQVENLGEMLTLTKENVDRMSMEDETDVIFVGFLSHSNNSRISKFVSKNSKHFRVKECNEIYVDQLLKLKHLQTIDFAPYLYGSSRYVRILDNRDIEQHYEGQGFVERDCLMVYDNFHALPVFKSFYNVSEKLQTLVHHFQKCETKIMFAGHIITDTDLL